MLHAILAERLVLSIRGAAESRDHLDSKYLPNIEVSRPSKSFAGEGAEGDGDGEAILLSDRRVALEPSSEMILPRAEGGSEGSEER